MIYGYSIAPRSWVCVLATINFVPARYAPQSFNMEVNLQKILHVHVYYYYTGYDTLLGTVDSPFIGVHGIPSMILQQYTPHRMLSGEPLPPWPPLPTNIGATHQMRVKTLQSMDHVRPLTPF